MSLIEQNAVRFVVCYMLCTSGCLYGLFEHDRAIVAMQKGDSDTALELLKNKMFNNPHDAKVLYDAGVASYRKGEYEQAHAYFDRVTQQDAVDPVLKEQAHFNAGNALVALKRLQQALDQYQEVLSMNPKNAQAQHNAERVKEMLKQQEQQQQDQQQQNQDQKDQQDQNQDQQNKENNPDQQQKDQQKNDQQKSNKQGQQDNKQDQEGKSNDSLDQQQQQNKEQRDRHEQQRQQAGDDEKRNKDDKAKQTAQDKQQDNKRDNGGEHAKDSDKKDAKKQSQDTSKKDKGQKSAGEQEQVDAQQGKGKQGPEREAWLAKILDERDSEDEKYAKALIKAQVGKEQAGQHGQNNW